MSIDAGTGESGPPQALLDVIAEQSGRPVSAQGSALERAVREQFGPSFMALLLYGSCLRSDDLGEGVVDLYAVLERYDYGRTGKGSAPRRRWLPPDVYYHDVHGIAGAMRVKLTVISIADLERGANHWFHSYIYARFAQPVRLLYARDVPARARIQRVLAACVVRFLREAATVAVGANEVGLEQLWSAGLTLTYGAELRPEPGDRVNDLVEMDRADYAALTAAAAPALAGRLVPLGNDRYRCTLDPRQRVHLLRSWRVRRWLGRVLSVLRWMKAAFTFRGSIDYAAWKIERHTGIRIEVTPALRRFPLLFGWRVLWRLIRRGALR